MKLAVLQIKLILSFSILGQLPKTYDPFEKYSINSMQYVESCNFKLPESQLIQLVNDYRRENGLSSIKINLEMNDFAKNFILKLLDENALYHSELNNWTYSVENLYTEYGFGSIIGLNEEWYNQIAQQTIDSWKKSPGHNDNLLNPNISEVGIAFEIKTKQKNGNYSYVLDGIFVGK